MRLAGNFGELRHRDKYTDNDIIFPGDLYGNVPVPSYSTCAGIDLLLDLTQTK